MDVVNEFVRGLEELVDNLIREEKSPFPKPYPKLTIPSVTEQTPEKKKVLFFCTSRDNSHGVPVVMNNIARTLQERDDYEVYFLINPFLNPSLKLYDSNERLLGSFNNREELAATMQEFLANIDIFHVHSGHFCDPFVYLGIKKHNKIGCQSFLRYLRKAKIVFTDHSNPTRYLHDLKQTGVDYSSLDDRLQFLQDTQLQEDDERFRKKDGWREGYTQTVILCQRQMYELADAVVHVSGHQWGYNKWIVPGPHDEIKHHVIYNGIDLIKYRDNLAISERVKELRKKMGIANEKIIFYAGRLDEGKGFFDLLEAVNLLQQPISGRQYKLVVAGKITESEKERIKQKYPKLKENIIFAGLIQDRKELAAYNSLADVAVQPTRGECFNQSVGEALALGTPAITTDFAGPKEVYVDTGLAYSVPVTDLSSPAVNPKLLAQKIKEVLQDGHAASIKTGRAQEYIAKNLSVEVMIQKYIELYEKLLCSKKRTAKENIYASILYQDALASVRRGDVAKAKEVILELKQTVHEPQGLLAVSDLETITSTLGHYISARQKKNQRAYLGDRMDLGTRPKVHNKHKQYISDRKLINCNGLFNIVDLDCMNTFAWKEIARYTIDDRCYEDALAFLNHVILVDPNDKEARVMLASVYEKLGHHAKKVHKRLEDVYCALFAEAYKRKKFTVSYIMPLYKERKDHIITAIDSLLQQKRYEDLLEIIIVDDGSKEHLGEFVKGHYKAEVASGKIKVVTKQNNGAATARNLGLRIALSGNPKYISFLDADDVAYPEKTQKLVNFLENNQDIGFVHAQVNFIDQEGKSVPNHSIAKYFRRCWDVIGHGPYDTRSLESLRLFRCPINNQSVMVKADVIREAGYQHPFWLRAQDMMYWRSIAQTGAHFGFLDDVVAKYRVS